MLTAWCGDTRIRRKVARRKTTTRVALCIVTRRFSMDGPLVRVLMVAACAAFTSCGPPTVPSALLVGDWNGRVAPEHFRTLAIRFTQEGSAITGRACVVDGNELIFRDAPVGVDNPNITIDVVAGQSRFVFKGVVDATGTIAGASGSTPDNLYPMSLGRGGNYCGL